MQDQPTKHGDLRATVGRWNAGFKRFDSAAEQVFRIIFSAALIVGSILILPMYVLPWYFSVWSSGWGKNAAALVICLVPIVMLILAFLGGLIILWETIAGMMEERPLVDEKAHGDAGRANPTQTASAATGSQREPIHDKKFPD